MEIIMRRNYRTVLKNEVPVSLEPMKKLFKENNIYVFGYGSLLFENGWHNRSMLCLPEADDLIECVLKGFKRGPFGVFGYNNYYGIIREARKHCNGVLTPVHTLKDWINLMFTEHIAGLTEHVNYRVVDVTDDICQLSTAKEFRKPFKVHCVCNRPTNKQKMLDTYPAPGYYGYIWAHILMERSRGFAEEFLRTGGYTSAYDVSYFLEKQMGNED